MLLQQFLTNSKAMWEIETEDFCYINTQNFFFPYDYQPHAPWASESPTQVCSKKQSVNSSRRTRTAQINTRRIRKLSRRIKELEAQLSKIKECRKEQYCRCQVERMKDFQKDQVRCQALNMGLMCQFETPCPEDLQFEEFDMAKQSPKSPQKQVQQNAQSWIFTGMMMLIMGININGYDENSFDVYKLAKQSIIQVRNQVQNSLDDITLPIFYSKLFNDVPNSSNAAPSSAGSGLELQGMRLDVVDQDVLMFEEHISYKLKYQALNAMSQFMKQYVVIY